MFLIELFVPKGVFDADARESLARRLVDTLMVEDGSHAVEVLDSTRSLMQVLVHEPATWMVGDRSPVDVADPPRYLVRVTLPSAWRKDASEGIVTAMTDALAEAERAAGRDPGRLHREPHAWIQLVGLPEHSYGTYGRTLGSLELIDQLTRPHRENIAHAAAGADEPIDPVCGMVATLDDPALTLEVDGTTYGFCSGTCRRIFADDAGVPLSA